MNKATIPIHPTWIEDAAPFSYGTMGEPVGLLGPAPVALGAPLGGLPPLVELVFLVGPLPVALAGGGRRTLRNHL